MALLPIDAMDDATRWHALAPDGMTPSTALAMADDPSRARPASSDAISARVTASAAAKDHVLRRNLAAPLDLSGFDELRLWLSSSRPADGTPAQPFFLELRLASAAVALGDPANTWQRYLPVAQGGAWASARLTLGDLPAGIRSAVTVIQLRCAADSPFQCHLDDLYAVREEMIGDVDAALRALLDGVVTIGGNPVPAVLHPGNGALSQARPYLQILHYDVVYARERTQATRPRGDFTDQGYRLRAPSNAYDLFYQITAVADDRATQQKMLDAALRVLPPCGALRVNGELLPMDTVVVTPVDQLGGFRTDIIPLFYRVSTRHEVGTSDLVVAARNVIVGGEVGLP